MQLSKLFQEKTRHDLTAILSLIDAVLVAIDIAKHKNAVLVERPGSPRRRILTVINSHAEHDRLIDELTGYGARLSAASRPPATITDHWAGV